jgi:hypothetical protein
MGKKRQHADSESSANDHEGIARKRPRPNHRHHARGQKAVDDSLNAIKKRVRDIERLLARENLKLPANKQNDLERELAAHKQRLAEAQAKKARSKMIHKYHMVRFFGASTTICPGSLALSLLTFMDRKEEGHEICEAAREETGASHRSRRGLTARS